MKLRKQVLSIGTVWPTIAIHYTMMEKNQHINEYHYKRFMEEYAKDINENVKNIIDNTNSNAYITIRDIFRDYSIPKGTSWSKLKTIEVNYNGYPISAQELAYSLFHQRLRKIKRNVHKCEDNWISRYKFCVVCNSRFRRKPSIKQTKETERITELDLNGEEFKEINEYIQANEW
ncbi:unnamed protein product [Cunninghamella blakesleeana]